MYVCKSINSNHNIQYCTHYTSTNKEVELVINDNIMTYSCVLCIRCYLRKNPPYLRAVNLCCLRNVFYTSLLDTT